MLGWLDHSNEIMTDFVVSKVAQALGGRQLLALAGVAEAAGDLWTAGRRCVRCGLVLVVTAAASAGVCSFVAGHRATPPALTEF